ncbi:MAG TPA: hypothetical protein VIG33_18400 [Pseudobdellovibrionaceae bacterium]|jgi:hypothetical protein
MMVSADPKKIRTTIRRYERNFEKDPTYRDGGGTRFLIGPYYLLIGDVAGAMEHYHWFQENFADSSDEPIHTLSWALALFRTGQVNDAVFRLRCAHLSNPYMIPALLKIPHGQPSVRRGSNWEEELYIMETSAPFFEVWAESEQAWLRQTWNSPEFTALVKEHISIRKALEAVPVGPRRTELVERLFSLAETSAITGEGSH